MEINPETGKIKLPAHVAAERQRTDERRRAIGELREWLKEEHRRALDENPLGQFKFRVPLDTLKALTPEERHEIEAFEQQTDSRLRGMSQAKDHQKRMFVAAGGNEQAFEEGWQMWGEEAALQQRAAEVEERARRSSPYS